MPEQIIELTPDVKHFEEIFFKNRQGNVLYNDATKALIRLTTFSIILTIAFYFLGLKKPDFSWLVFWGLLFSTIFSIFLIIAINKFHTWKSRVKIFLRDFAEVKKGKLILKPDAFQLEVDDRTIIEKLSHLKKVEIFPTYIIVKAEGENYFFPAKSMSLENFNFLSNYLKDKVS